MEFVNNSEFRGFSNFQSTKLHSFSYRGFIKAEQFFEDIKEWFLLNDTPADQMFKIAWSCLSGKAKLNLTPGILTSYTQFKKAFLLVFRA